MLNNWIATVFEINNNIDDLLFDTVKFINVLK